MNAAIRTQNLGKRFRGVVALNGFDLEVPAGSVFALVGPNGAGKTTAIKTVMNIMRPNSGHAEILGVESTRLSPRELQSIGYVSENQQMPEWMTVDYFLAYLKPFYPSWDTDLAQELVRQFDLPLDRKLKHLSRGMRMKTALASSLAYRPKLIILDEPFTGLDALVRDELIEGLLDLAAGATVFISSHDLAEIETFASHIGYLDGGRLRLCEETSSLVERFREVEITFDGAAVVPGDWPDTWMRPNTEAAVLRFVESGFDHERTSSKIQQLFPAARDVSFSPLSLRDIFVVLAKSSRGAASKTEAQ